jgi:hypothetical protein
MSWGLGEGECLAPWTGVGGLIEDDPAAASSTLPEPVSAAVLLGRWSLRASTAAASIEAPATAEVPPALTGFASRGLATAAALDISDPFTRLTFVLPAKENFFFGISSARLASILCLVSAMVAVHCLRS